MILNKYNFLRWQTEEPSTDQPPLPWSYWRDRDRVFMPIAYPTEAMSFYIQSLNDQGLNFPGFNDFRLDIIEATGNNTVATDVAPLFQHFLDSPADDMYNIYSTVVIPALADGVYYYNIYDTFNAVSVCTSNYFEVRNNKAALDIESAYFRFQHDRYFYGIRYADIPDFYQQFRLPMALVDRQPESEKEVYKEVTTGKQRTFNNYLSRFIKLELYYLDQEAHEAASILFEHEYIELNGKRYRLKSTYKELTNVLGKVTKGEVELYDEEFSSANRC